MSTLFKLSSSNNFYHNFDLLWQKNWFKCGNRTGLWLRLFEVSSSFGDILTENVKTLADKVFNNNIFRVYKNKLSRIE